MELSMNFLHTAAVAMLVASAGLVMHGCAKDDVIVVPGNNATVDEAFGTGRFAQVDRVARPLVNEAFVVTNDFLNAFNTFGPNLDVSDAAATLRTEIVTVLRALDLADGVTNVDQQLIANAFLPDVMRIDVSIPASLATAAYDRQFNALGAPIGGRKLEDDAWDITAKLVVGSDAPDNVPYARPAAGPGSTNPAIGHQLLNGQGAPRGAATFPYLAPPN